MIPNVVTNIGPVKPHVLPVAAEIANRWVLYFIWGAPGKGTGDHAEGLALDFMTYEHGEGVDNPGPKRDDIGDAIAAYLLEHRVRLNVAHVIWNRRIASALSSPAWSWRTYYGENPHVDHPHVSFKPRGTYTPPPTGDEMTPQQLDELVERTAQRTAELVWKERLPNPKAKAGATPPRASEYLIGTGNEVDALEPRLERIEKAVAPAPAAKKAAATQKGTSK